MSKAVSVRAHGDTSARTSGQSDHDLREGLTLDEHGELVLSEGADRKDAERRRKLIPAYVDKTRCHLNSVIVPPKRGPELRAICEERRSQRDMQRKLKSNAAVSSSIIVTFGKEIQPKIEALPVEVQNRAFTELIERIAKEANNTVSGIVVHRDETAIHAHGQMPAVNLDGMPNSKVMDPKFHTDMQDWAAEIWQRYEPEVERGVRKAERIARGDDASKIYNRSVKRLHADLPAEIEAKEAELEAKSAELDAKNEELATVQADVDKHQRHLDKARADLRLVIEGNEAESAKAEKIRKRVATYENRLSKAEAELARLVAEIEDKQSTLETLERATINGRNDLAKIEAQKAAATEELDGLTSAVAQKKTNIESLRVKRAALLARLQSLSAASPG